LVHQYYAVDEAIATDQTVPLKRYYGVASGRFAQSLLRGAQELRAKDYRVIGKVRVGTPQIQKLELSPPNGRPPAAKVTACIDVSGVNVVDKNGKSVVEPTRANAYIERLSVEKMKVGWRVTDGVDTGTSKCAD
jgi:hypothetical protein